MKLRATIAAVAVLGAGIAAYLTYVHYANVAPICVNGGCEKVQHSSYATIAGIPVAVLGLVGWALLLVTAAFRGPTAAFAGGAIALLALVFSGYLLWAQLGPIGAICQWCVGNDVAVTVVAALCLIRVLAEDDHVPDSGMAPPLCLRHAGSSRESHAWLRARSGLRGGRARFRGLNWNRRGA